MPRILIVDDEPEMVRGLEDNLRFEGYQTVAAPDGRRGLALALSEAPDLILLDVMMPVMDGWAVLEELLRRPAPVPPVVIVSAASAPESVKRALTLGAIDYLVKTDTTSRLAPLVAEIVAASPAEREARRLQFLHSLNGAG